VAGDGPLGAGAGLLGVGAGLLGAGAGLLGAGAGLLSAGAGLPELGAGDGVGGTWPVTVQVKLTEPAPPDGVLAVTVTVCLPAAEAEMVPVIRPRPVIDKPRGRPAAVKAGGCPAVACSDLTCSRIAVPAAFR
jgi:hypothetical protein